MASLETSGSRLTITGAVKSAREARKRYSFLWRNYQSELQGVWYRRGEGRKRITNYPYLFMTSFLPEIAGKIPDVTMKPVRELTDADTAMACEIACEAIARRQKLLSELEDCVCDSFYAFGVGKVGIEDAGGFYGDSMWLDATMPFFERISPFCFLWDESAGRFSRATFMGEEFLRSKDSVLADQRYDTSNLKDVPVVGDELDEGDRNRFEDFDEIPDAWRIVELYVRPTQKMYTLLERGENEFEIIREEDFYGDTSKGPYHIMHYHRHARYAVPISPVAAWFEQYLELEMNERKMNDAAQAEKRVAYAESSDVELAKRYKAAKPEDLIIGNGKIGEIHTGGVTEERIIYRSHSENALERVSGVTEQRLGMSTSGGSTATESSIVAQNQNRRTMWMRTKVAEFCAEIFDSIKWYVINERSMAMMTTIHSPEGLPAEILIRGGPVTDPFTGEAIPGQADASMFTVSVEPDTLFMDNSMMSQARALEKANFVLGTLRPALQTQGMDINMISYSQWIADNAGISNIDAHIVPMTPMAMGMGQMAQMGQQETGQNVTAMLGKNKTQSGIMNSPVTNGAISEGTRNASPMRQANTPYGSNNTPAGVY